MTDIVLAILKGIVFSIIGGIIGAPLGFFLGVFISMLIGYPIILAINFITGKHIDEEVLYNTFTPAIIVIVIGIGMLVGFLIGIGILS